MANPSGTSHVYVGTAARVPGAVSGIFRQTVGSDQWERLSKGLPERMDVQAITIHPTDSNLIFAGSQDGPYRSRDGGASWEKLPFPDEGLEVWSILIHPRDPRTVFLAVRMGLFRSADRGQTWQDMEIGRFSPLTYARDVVVSPHNPRTLVAALSPAARSTDGSLYRSDDLGQTWRRIDHGIKAESTMMAVSLHPRDPEQVYSVARLGQVFGTRDGGKTWKEWRVPAPGTEG